MSSGSRSRAELAAALNGVLLDPEAAAALDVHGRTDAAVLVALFDRGRELHVVLTKRRDDLRRHAGEISFPGGRRDPGEDDLRQTALREALEEIGLPREAVLLAGALQPTPTIATDYAVYPFVGLIEDGHRWHPSAFEVDEVFEFSLAVLRAGAGRRRVERRGIRFLTDTYLVDGHIVWGATARILAELLERVVAAGLLAPDRGDARQAS
ncbi:unannotated protein [freshwater metagenome]|uniref:Unannotated protein n=1 Tax=freshwater metagenome TaxID=449393 RepID=A0A6J7IK28_9ZZZZ|nr:NUDIX domain-containing protein [Actinomycetota bacterium]